MKPPLPPRRNAETLKRETLGHQSFHLKGRDTKQKKKPLFIILINN